MSGPLDGVRLLEFAGIGPAPFAVMLLADMGADVVRVDRGDEEVRANLVRERGRSGIVLDLKSPAGIGLALAAIERADVLVEGFRPGVMERLGLGPDVALERNPRLVYGRMTGWGQTGPLAHAAGHDITYIALTGALDAVAPDGTLPHQPLNLVGDFGGGALYLAFGIAAALYERERSGRGQVIDAAIVDGTASLMANFSGISPNGERALDMGRRLLGGGAPNYRCYECADGKYVAVGPLEPKFLAELLHQLRVGEALDSTGEPPAPAVQASGQSRGPIAADASYTDKIAAAFKQKTRDEWAALLGLSDACVAPVLHMDEAPFHAHMRARHVFEEIDGVVQPAPAPRFSRTPGALQSLRRDAVETGREALRRWGVPL